MHYIWDFCTRKNPRAGGRNEISLLGRSLTAHSFTCLHTEVQLLRRKIVKELKGLGL